MLLNIILCGYLPSVQLFGDSFLLETLSTFGFDSSEQFYSLSLSFLLPFPPFLLFPFNVSVIYSSLLYHQTSFYLTFVTVYKHRHTHIDYYIYSHIHIYKNNPNAFPPLLCVPTQWLSTFAPWMDLREWLISLSISI